MIRGIASEHMSPHERGNHQCIEGSRNPRQGDDIAWRRGDRVDAWRQHSGRRNG
jgi:hypothetical protein